MHAYKIRDDATYANQVARQIEQGAQVRAIDGDHADIGFVPSPALAMQQELVRRVATGGAAARDNLSFAARALIITVLAVAAWIPFAAVAAFIF